MSKLDQLITKIGGAVDQYALATAIMDRMGGHEGLAEYIVKGLRNSEPGSAAYAQLLRAVLELYGKVSKEMGSKMLEEEIPDSELEAAVADAKVKRVRGTKSRPASSGDGGRDADVADWGDSPSVPKPVEE